MSNKNQIETSLKSLILDDDRAFVAMLSGEWGIGKTYFWNKFTAKHLEQEQDFMRGENPKVNDVVYISLFGKNSLSEIEEYILTNLFQYKGFTKKHKQRLTVIGGWISKYVGLPSNISAGSILSLFNPNHFKNIIICFDDFERLSDKVPLKDVMGLISQFKEQKKCKVIMILNERELNKLSDIDGKKHDEIFALYKEKIVDYNFHYQPSQKELFEAIKEDVDKITFCEHQTIYDFFKKIDLKNIRIMKQALYLLEKFSFIKNTSYNTKVIDEFVEIALNLFVFKAKTNYQYTEFKNMTGYRTNKALKAAYVDLGLYYLKDIIESEIYSYLDTHIIKQEEMEELLQEKNENPEITDITHLINAINKEYFTSFQTEDAETSKALIDALTAYKEQIHQSFLYHKFKQFLENIQKYTPTQSLEKSIKKTIIENYIKYYTDYPDRDEKDFYTRVTNLDTILDDYPWAKTFYTTHNNPSSLSLDEIPSIMEEVCRTNFCSDIQFYQLDSFSHEDYKTIIIKLSSYKFTSTIIQFCSWTSIGGENLDPIKVKITQALQKTRKINTEFKRKTEYIAKHAKLNLEDEK